MQKLTLTTNAAWGLVLLGGLVECFWVSGLKYASNTLLYALTGAGIVISFCCMLFALKKLEVSIAYSVFVGIGTAGVVLFEILFFGESFSVLKVLFIGLLLIGVIGLKLVSKEEPKALENSKSLGDFKNAQSIENTRNSGGAL